LPFRGVLIFFSISPQYSLWLFSVSSVLNSKKRDKYARALQTVRRLVVQAASRRSGWFKPIAVAFPESIIAPRNRPVRRLVNGGASVLTAPTLHRRIAFYRFGFMFTQQRCDHIRGPIIAVTRPDRTARLASPTPIVCPIGLAATMNASASATLAKAALFMKS
jgi:hypothetical protein